MEKSRAIDQSKTEQMALLLAQYGQAPHQIRDTVEALLDYSAATGGDAIAATESLIASVDMGKRSFKDVGLQYNEVSGKSAQLAEVTKALAERFAGASAKEGDTLSARTSKATEAFLDLGKMFGGFIADVENKLEVMDRLRITMGFIGELFEPSEFTQRESIISQMAPMEKFLREYNAAVERGDKNVSSQDIDIATQYTQRLAELEGELKKLNDAARARQEAEQKAIAASIAGHVDGKTTKELRGSTSSPAEKRRQLNEDVYRVLAEGADEEERLTQRRNDLLDRLDEEREKAAQVALEKRAALEKSAADERAREAERQATEARQQAEAIGGAFVNAFANQINRLASGGEMSIEETIIDILTGVAGVALTAGGLGFLSPVVGSLGGLAKSGLKKHSGGWIDAPRFHSGAWVGADEQPAVLQTGERVLSRSEVRGMGGPSGVDAAARGGGGARIVVQTLDGSSTREFFERQGGRALLNAVRTGRGAPSLLFGGG
jgi:hypothetical protein